MRIEFGFNTEPGELSKPILSRKPQINHTIADTPPALNVSELGVPQSNMLTGNGQVTVKDGNLNSVTNSTLSGARQTAYVTQENGTNGAINHWSNSNRVIGNFDNQNRTAARTNAPCRATTETFLRSCQSQQPEQFSDRCGGCKRQSG